MALYMSLSYILQQNNKLL